MGSSHPTAQYKMFRPLFCVPLAIALVLLQQVPTASGTYALTLTTGATTLLSLTAAQSTALAAVGLLGIKAKLLAVALFNPVQYNGVPDEEDEDRDTDGDGTPDIDDAD